jgi:LPS-assembly protein
VDVAIGATNVQFPRELLKEKLFRRFPLFFKGWFFVLLSLLFFQATLAVALGERQPIHFSGDKQLVDRKSNQVELFGHAIVTQPGETLSADYIKINMTSRTLDARGNCLYVASGSVISGEEMHFNLDTRTGTILNGRVSNESFSLTGEKIDKLGDRRFQTHWGAYSTCRDCAPSWGLLAEDVDMQVEGYAFLSNVTAQIKSAPAFWIPYLVVPMKTRRQSGVLFPPLAFSGIHGAQLIVPYFWAINRSADMTAAAGIYASRGLRAEWEGRYSLSPRSQGKANFFFTRDRTFPQKGDRFSIDVAQTQELPFGFEEKLRVMEVGDNQYPFLFARDVSVSGEAFLPSSLTISRASSDASFFLSAQRFRNLLNSSPGDPDAQLTEFDQRTVQVYPTVTFALIDRFLWESPIAAGLSTNLTNFYRPADAGAYDIDAQSRGTSFGEPLPPGASRSYQPGIDPLRRATRFSVSPTVYTTIRPFDTFSLIPSAQYRFYHYDFKGFVSPLNRGYLLLQADLTTQIERIYENPENANIPRTKHLIRPLLTYSLIPFRNEDPNHPFVAQIENSQARNLSGYNFDDYDIIPYDYNRTGANYFVPQGNSLAYGFTTQWIQRRGRAEVAMPSYRNVAEFSAGQAVNFREIYVPKDPESRHIFTRFFSVLGLNFDKLISQTTYFYYPDFPATTPRHTITTGATYIFERSLHQRILTYDRSFTLGYTFNQVNAATSNLTGTVNFSLSDYILPSASISYGFLKSQLFGAGLNLQLQSPSRCWKFSSGLNYQLGIGYNFVFDLALNITGSGFGGVGELATLAGVPPPR